MLVLCFDSEQHLRWHPSGFCYSCSLISSWIMGAWLSGNQWGAISVWVKGQFSTEFERLLQLHGGLLVLNVGVFFRTNLAINMVVPENQREGSIDLLPWFRNRALIHWLNVCECWRSLKNTSKCLSACAITVTRCGFCMGQSRLNVLHDRITTKRWKALVLRLSTSVARHWWLQGHSDVAPDLDWQGSLRPQNLHMDHERERRLGFVGVLVPLGWDIAIQAHC